MRTNHRQRILALAWGLVVAMPALAQTTVAPTQSAPMPPRIAAATQKAKSFVVILQSSSNPDEPLHASIPAQFQDFEVFTQQRASEGLVLFDICLGYFSSLSDAEQGQRILLRRFPNASVIPYRTGKAR